MSFSPLPVNSKFLIAGLFVSGLAIGHLLPTPEAEAKAAVGLVGAGIQTVREVRHLREDMKEEDVRDAEREVRRQRALAEAERLKAERARLQQEENERLERENAELKRQLEAKKKKKENKNPNPGTNPVVSPGVQQGGQSSAVNSTSNLETSLSFLRSDEFSAEMRGGSGNAILNIKPSDWLANVACLPSSESGDSYSSACVFLLVDESLVHIALNIRNNQDGSKTIDTLGFPLLQAAVLNLYLDGVNMDSLRAEYAAHPERYLNTYEIEDRSTMDDDLISIVEFASR